MQQFFTLNHGNRQRRYLVYEPPLDDKPLSLVMMLHGAGGTAAWTLEETRWQETAAAHGFLLVLPEGTRADPEQPPGFLQNPQVWNDGNSRSSFGQTNVDDVGFLNAVLDEVMQRFAVDPQRVVATGFSNGAGMVFRLAAARSERFAAIAPVAGLCPLDIPQPASPLPTLYLVGSVDPLLPLDGGEVSLPWGRLRMQKPPVWDTLQRWATALGCSPEPTRNDAESGLLQILYGPAPDGAELRAYVVEGLGHHWPGGRGLLNPRLAGPPSNRLDANELIWHYCSRQRRP